MLRKHKIWGDVPGGGGHLFPAACRGTTRSSPDELHQLPIFSLQLPLFQSFLDFTAMMAQSLQVLSQNMFIISLHPLDLIPAACFGLNTVFVHISLMGQYSHLLVLCFTSLKHTILVLSQFVGQYLFVWCIFICTQMRLNSSFFPLNFVKLYMWGLTRALHSVSGINIVKGHFSLFFSKCHQVNDAYPLPLYKLLQLMEEYFYF